MRRSLARLGAALLAPALVRAQASKPAMPHGVAAGDVGGTRAIVWSRTDRPARMVVEYSTTESFRDARRVRRSIGARDHRLHGPRRADRSAAGPADLLSRAFQDLADLRAWSDPLIGSFTHASRGCRARRHDRLVGRHGRPGLGHQPRVRRPAALRHDAQRAARSLHPLRRHDLRRRAARRRGEAGRRDASGGTS